MNHSISFLRFTSLLAVLFLSVPLSLQAQDCYQGNESSTDPWGYDISQGSLKVADDILIGPNRIYFVWDMDINIFTDYLPSVIKLHFYRDDNGQPGEWYYTTDNLDIADYEVIGDVFGFPLYKVNLFLYNEFLSFSGGPTGARFWMQPEASFSNDEPVYWEITEEGTLGEPVHRQQSNGEWTIPIPDAQGVFEMHCEHNDFHCFFEVVNTVLPITHVRFSNLDHASSPDSSEPMENFTGIRVYASPGEEYEVTLEGNSGGNFTDYYSMFIGKYSQYGEFDYLSYDIGTISDSNGEDGAQATAVITIPEDLPEGRYRLRFVKDRGVYPDGPCTRVSYGQGEEYELIIKEDLNDDDFCFVHYPEEPYETFAYDLDETIVAADFHLEENMRVREVSFAVEGYFNATYSLYFYEDDNGYPGELIMQTPEMSPSSIIQKQWLESYIVIYYLSFKLPEPLLLNSGTNGKKYWMGISSDSYPGDSGWLAQSDQMYNDTPLRYSTNDGITWTTAIYGEDLFLVVEGECGVLGTSDITASDFDYYPNPVKDILNFKSSQPIDKAEIYTLNGQKISTTQITAKENSLNLSALPTGVYMIKVILKDGSVETFKVVKEW